MATYSYRDLIFTKHAYARFKERSLAVDSIYQTVHSPEKKFTSKKSEDSYKYIKHLANRQYQVVAKYLKSEDKYLIISVWVRGEEDRPPLVWQIISSPFRLLFWLLSQAFKKSSK